MQVEIDNLTKSFGDLVAVDGVSLTIEDGEFVTLVGPSGCGKTTTLRCIAGLETPTSGSISFDDRDVTDTSPKDRDIAFVFQDYALYPHMTARKNISFALEDTGMASDEIQKRVTDVAEMLGIENHLDKKPGNLSGGQQQRVALGRSIVRDPDIFLLDEPLANLDAKLRVQMRAELQQLHQELQTTTIYVTHDQEEAMTMSDRVAILNQGELQQIASPEEVYTQPANEFVAGFIGSPSMNFISCSTAGDEVETDAFSIEAADAGDAAATTLGIRPEDVDVVDPGDGIAESTVNVFENVGAYNIVYLEVPGLEEELVAQVPPSQHVNPGERVGVDLDADRIHLFDEAGQAVRSPKIYSEEQLSAPS
ncbi:MAG: ABC transporter ATP-binding protein [Haloarculaceae archaeon]